MCYIIVYVSKGKESSNSEFQTDHSNPDSKKGLQDIHSLFPFEGKRGLHLVFSFILQTNPNKRLINQLLVSSKENSLITIKEAINNQEIVHNLWQ